MDAKDLKYSTMDPENRVLIQVNIEDLEYDEMIISTCMGDDVAARKRMILDDELGELM